VLHVEKGKANYMDVLSPQLTMQMHKSFDEERIHGGGG
jgi:hypothetical protein